MEPIKLEQGRDPIVAMGTRWSDDAKNYVRITCWVDGNTTVNASQTVTCPAEHAQAMADWLESLAPTPEAVAEKLWELRTGCRWESRERGYVLMRGGDFLGKYGESKNGRYYWSLVQQVSSYADSLPAAKAALLSHLGLT